MAKAYHTTYSESHDASITYNNQLLEYSIRRAKDVSWIK